MNLYFQSKYIYLFWTLLIGFSVPSFGLANDEILFQIARSTINDQTVSNEYSLAHRQSLCLYALSSLRREKETFQLMESWPTDRQSGVERRLSMCWKSGLYWAGLNYSLHSELSLSRKLASLAGHSNVPPEKLITQLLDQETKPFKQADQEMVKLLQFSAKYDGAIQSKDPDQKIQELVTVAIALAPQALHLLDTSYPAKGYHTISYHPVKYEIAQCALAIQDIVPIEKRTDAINMLMERIDLLFGLGCSRRGWTSAFDAGLELLAKKDESSAIQIWQSRYLENYGVEVSNSIILSSKNQINCPKLSHFISSVKSILDILRNQTYKKKPEVLSALLQEPDSEIWRFYVLLTLETARLYADEKLLHLGTCNLLEQSQRLHNPNVDDTENMIQDLSILYFSAYRAAKRVNDKKTQKEMMKRLLSLFPKITDEGIFDVLSTNVDEISIWAFLISDSSHDGVSLHNFEETLFRASEGLVGKLETHCIGIIWATTGKTKIKGKNILTMYNKSYEFHGIAFGAGFAVGSGRALLTVGEAWTRLCQADRYYNTMECLAAFCTGYTKGRENPQAIWEARLIQELSNTKHPQQ